MNPQRSTCRFIILRRKRRYDQLTAPKGTKGTECYGTNRFFARPRPFSLGYDQCHVMKLPNLLLCSKESWLDGAGEPAKMHATRCPSQHRFLPAKRLKLHIARSIRSNPQFGSWFHISPSPPSPLRPASPPSSSGKARARTGLRMMPTSPLPPLKFRTAGFPQYGFKAGFSDKAFPACWFAIALRAPSGHRDSLRCVRDGEIGKHLRASGCSALPQGPSLRSGLFCPGPSSLNRPHPPHSRAQPDFAALRLIPAAFAVHIRICLGDPRLVLSFS